METLFSLLPFIIVYGHSSALICGSIYPHCCLFQKCAHKCHWVLIPMNTVYESKLIN